MAHRGARRGKRDQLDGDVGDRASDYEGLGDIFWHVFPAYLAIGMTADEFWHGNPRLAKSYSEAWKARTQSAYHAEWRQGLYVAQAIGACFSKEGKYPEEPMFTVESDEEVAERKAREHMQRMKDALSAQVAAARKKMEPQGSD